MLKPPIVCSLHNSICGFVLSWLLLCELLPPLILFKWMRHSSEAQRSCYQQLPISAFLQHLRNQRYKEDIKDLSNTWINKPYWIKRIYQQPFHKSGSIKTKKYYSDPRLSTIRNRADETWLMIVFEIHTHRGLERQWRLAPSLLILPHTILFIVLVQHECSQPTERNKGKSPLFLTERLKKLEGPAALQSLDLKHLGHLKKNISLLPAQTSSISVIYEFWMCYIREHHVSKHCSDKYLATVREKQSPLPTMVRPAGKRRKRIY